MMKKQKYKVSLLVYIKNKYKYSKQEEKLGILADKLGGREIGGGTCPAAGKRDKQYYFNSEKDANTFLTYSTVKDTILKEHDMVRVVTNMGYGDKVYEEALHSLREENVQLQKNLEKHVLMGADFSGIINEMLKYIEQKDDKDYLYFVDLVEKALERNR